MNSPTSAFPPLSATRVGQAESRAEPRRLRERLSASPRSFRPLPRPPKAVRGVPRRLTGVRSRTAAVFALGAVLVCAVLAGSTYVIARAYLTGQRERAVVRQAGLDAQIVRDGLAASGTSVSDVLGRIAPPARSEVLVQYRGQWFSTSLDLSPEQLPRTVVATSTGDGATAMWTSVGKTPSLVVSIPLRAEGAVFHEVVGLQELASTLDTLRLTLITVALFTAVAAAALGRWAAGRAVRPLDQVASAAAGITGGQLSTRLAPTDDPDLAGIVASFNGMVDALQARIEREARFTADAAHELRSPLTALVAAVDLLQARSAELPDRSRAALELTRRELDRFRRLLEDLLALARLDAGVDANARELVDLHELVEQALLASHRSPSVLAKAPAIPVQVQVAKRQMERALSNLFENAERHGDGLVAVQVRADQGSALVTVDDAGPGIPLKERERVFERFARAHGTRSGRPGTGLGLSLVAETVRAHDGDVWCAESPSGGARLVVRLPVAAPEAT